MPIGTEVKPLFLGQSCIRDMALNFTAENSKIEKTQILCSGEAGKMKIEEMFIV